MMSVSESAPSAGIWRVSPAGGEVVRIVGVADDQASALLGEIVTEARVIDQLSATTVALQAIRQARHDLARLPADTIGRVFERRHAVLAGDES